MNAVFVVFVFLRKIINPSGGNQGPDCAFPQLINYTKNTVNNALLWRRDKACYFETHQSEDKNCAVKQVIRWQDALISTRIWRNDISFNKVKWCWPGSDYFNTAVRYKDFGWGLQKWNLIDSWINFERFSNKIREIRSPSSSSWWKVNIFYASNRGHQLVPMSRASQNYFFWAFQCAQGKIKLPQRNQFLSQNATICSKKYYVK